MKGMLYIIQNDVEVPPGNILDFIAIPHVILHLCRGGFLPAAEQISALIVMGGAMGANDDARFPFLVDLKSLIRAVVAAGIPYLGICLGGQLLAAALGAKVVSRSVVPSTYLQIGFDFYSVISLIPATSSTTASR